MRAALAAPAVAKVVDLKTLQVTALPESSDLFYPVVSPDGRYITSATLDGQKLMLFDFNTHKWSELLKMDSGFVNWSKDSQVHLFRYRTEREPRLLSHPGCRPEVGTPGRFEGVSSGSLRIVPLEWRHPRWRPVAAARHQLAGSLRARFRGAIEAILQQSFLGVAGTCPAYAALSDQSVQSQGQGDANEGHGDQRKACLEESSLEGVHE